MLPENTHQTERPGWGWPLLMAFVRLPLILTVNGAVVLAFRIAGTPVPLTAAAPWSTLSVTVANVVCLALLRWRVRVEGLDMVQRIGFRRQRILRDLATGGLWSVALFAGLMAGVLIVALTIQRVTGLSFEQIYVGDADFSFELPAWVTVALALVSAVAFPILNAPVEELNYRGYAQPQLAAASGKAWMGLCISAIGFGLQHIAFAFTAASAVAYAVGFFIWGLGAGAIYNRQQRLMPLIVAHFISNLSFGLVPLFFVLIGT